MDQEGPILEEDNQAEEDNPETRLYAKAEERKEKVNVITSVTTCKICTFPYNDDERKPLFLFCGHTFCAKCVETMISNPIVSLRNPPALHCPNRCDKIVPFPNISKMRINWDLLSMVEYAASKESKFCEKHQHKRLKYFCTQDKAYICSSCLLAEH